MLYFFVSGWKVSSNSTVTLVANDMCQGMYCCHLQLKFGCYLHPLVSCVSPAPSTGTAQQLVSLEVGINFRVPKCLYLLDKTFLAVGEHLCVQSTVPGLPHRAGQHPPSVVELDLPVQYRASAPSQ